MDKIRIIFFGTPEFAASQLEAIVGAGYDVAAVVTMPDKPAGRGKKIQFSEVKKTALAHNLPLLQPEKLKAPEFLEQLESFKANLFIVVAFRMLPTVVWQMPKNGTFNLHASLLPQYRGAAPINFAIINGETETGLTTFFLNEEIDKGDILLSEKVAIGPNETAGELHDKLMKLGNNLTIKTILHIEQQQVRPKAQQIDPNKPIKQAPKITKEFCELPLNLDCASAHNHVRGLSPYPATRVVLHSTHGHDLELKVFTSAIEKKEHDMPYGTIVTDNAAFLKIALKDGFLFLTEVQQPGKKRMPIADFLRGTRLEGHWTARKTE